MIELETLNVYDDGDHHYRVVRPSNENDFIAELAKQYVELRTATLCDLREVSVEGIGVLSVDELKKRLHEATIPERTGGPLDVVRSDFGETLAYALLVEQYGTKFCYKSVRDRELIALPGRGIDAVGVEAPSNGALLTIVLGETKVSEENASPPQVVDRSKDSLRKQHRAHLSDRRATAKKIFNLARHAHEPGVRDLLLTATVMFEDPRCPNLRIAASATLVRPRTIHAVGDFGSFRTDPGDFAPAAIRFWILCTDTPIEELVTRWHEKVVSPVAA